MPVKFDAYDATPQHLEWALDPDSNAYRILEFLAEHPQTGFSPGEIHQATEIPRGSIGTTLRRLEDRGLVRHKEPYWAADPRGIDAYESVITSLNEVEASTGYDWGDADPSAYRIGLDAATEGPGADAT